MTCWGWYTSGQTAVPEGRYAAVTAGYARTCALAESGEAVCWGGDWREQQDAPPGRYTAISAGVAHTCALTESGEAVCWGWNSDGQADAHPVLRCRQRGLATPARSPRPATRSAGVAPVERLWTGRPAFGSLHGESAPATGPPAPSPPKARQSAGAIAATANSTCHPAATPPSTPARATRAPSLSMARRCAGARPLLGGRRPDRSAARPLYVDQRQRVPHLRRHRRRRGRVLGRRRVPQLLVLRASECRQESSGSRYRPWKTGVRFSANACAASRVSSRAMSSSPALPEGDSDW